MLFLAGGELKGAAGRLLVLRRKPGTSADTTSGDDPLWRLLERPRKQTLRSVTGWRHFSSSFVWLFSTLTSSELIFYLSKCLKRSSQLIWTPAGADLLTTLLWASTALFHIQGNRSIRCAPDLISHTHAHTHTHRCSKHSCACNTWDLATAQPNWVSEVHLHAINSHPEGWPWLRTDTCWCVCISRRSPHVPSAPIEGANESWCGRAALIKPLKTLMPEGGRTLK